jgi:Tfp pilus assembly PilM family ATPase
MKERTLPLGVDLGASRVRVAAISKDASGRTRLLATGGADIVDDPREALRLALEGIPRLERRGIAAIRTCDARLRSIRFPRMRMAELRRAVRFEGVSMFGESIDEQTVAVRSATVGPETLVAAAPALKVRETIDVLTSCGIRVTTVDHEACVFTRASQLPLLDIGLERSTLITVANGMPIVRSIPLGGAFFTDALAREFGTSLQIAEIRKRTIGLGGAANYALDAYARALGAQLEALQIGGLQTLFVCGNGARLSSLRTHIADAFGLCVTPVDLRTLIESDLPPEVEHAGAFDWYGAVASALPVRAASAV